ncbi:uncharacterized protein [Antedon mediterranea]|uniref:uncharacterized protein n=1 Tax=Antedon mediterranea TaxID=105859 RepID=UPI003AF4F69F
MQAWKIIVCLTAGMCCYSTAIQFIAEPFDTIVNYGETVVLRCALKDQGDKPLYWQNTDTQQFISMDHEIDPYRSFGNKTRERLSIIGDSRYGEYNLRIDNVTNLDSGSYACLYFDVFGYYSRPAEIKVVNPPMKDYPMCMMSPTTPAAIGDEVDLLCVSSGGKPAPILSWTSGGNLVPSVYVSGGIGGVTSNKYSLILNEDDRGKVFTCEASHEAFAVPKTCTIIPIGFNIPVYLRPKVKYATEGRRATFACYTDKSLEPTFHWYIGNKRLNSNDPRVTPTKDGVSKLKLRNLRISDNGTNVYCVITNRFGAKKNDSSLLLVFPSYYSGGKGTGKVNLPETESFPPKDNGDNLQPTVLNPTTKNTKLITTKDNSLSPTTSTPATPGTTEHTTMFDKLMSVKDTHLSGRTTMGTKHFVENTRETPKDHNTFEWKPNMTTSNNLSNQNNDIIENSIESTQSPHEDLETDVTHRGQQTNNVYTLDIITEDPNEIWEATVIASMKNYVFTTDASDNVNHLKSSQRPMASAPPTTSTTTDSDGFNLETPNQNQPSSSTSIQTPKASDEQTVSLKMVTNKNVPTPSNIDNFSTGVTKTAATSMLSTSGTAAVIDSESLSPSVSSHSIETKDIINETTNSPHTTLPITSPASTENFTIGLQTFVKEDVVPVKLVNTNKWKVLSSTASYRINSTTENIEIEAQNFNYTTPKTEGQATNSPTTKSDMVTRDGYTVREDTNMATTVSMATEKMNNMSASTSGKPYVSDSPFSMTNSSTEQTKIRISKIYHRSDKMKATDVGNTPSYDNYQTDAMMQSEKSVSEKPYLENVSEKPYLDDITDLVYNMQDAKTSTQIKITDESITSTISTEETTENIEHAPNEIEMTSIASGTNKQILTTAIRQPTHVSTKETVVAKQTTSQIVTNPVTKLIRTIMKSTERITSSNLQNTDIKTISPLWKTETLVDDTKDTTTVATPETSGTKRTTLFHTEDQTLSTVQPIEQIQTTKLNSDTTINIRSIENNRRRISTPSINDVHTTISQSHKTHNAHFSTTLEPTSDQKQTTSSIINDHVDTIRKPDPTLHPKVIPFGENIDTIPVVRVTTIIKDVNKQTTPDLSKPGLTNSDDSVPNTPETLLKTLKSNKTPRQLDDPTILNADDEIKTATVRRNAKIIMAAIVGMAVLSAFILTIFSILIKCFSKSRNGVYNHNHPHRWS